MPPPVSTLPDTLAIVVVYETRFNERPLFTIPDAQILITLLLANTRHDVYVLMSNVSEMIDRQPGVLSVGVFDVCIVCTFSDELM